jgi:hypothetical protein
MVSQFNSNFSHSELIGHAFGNQMAVAARQSKGPFSENNIERPAK